MKSLVSAIAIAGLIGTGFMGLGVTSASAQNSRAYCEQYARDASRQETGGNIIGGAAVGAIGGAVLGGILGGGKKGSVGTGAAIGAVGGGGLGAVNRKRVFDRAYAECINQQPRYVAPVAPAYAPPVGSYEWTAACDRKYKTFNPQTGYFIAKYDAYNQPVYRLCNLP